MKKYTIWKIKDQQDQYLHEKRGPLITSKKNHHPYESQITTDSNKVVLKSTILQQNDPTNSMLL